MSRTIHLEALPSCRIRLVENCDYIQNHFQVDRTNDLVEKLLNYPSVKSSSFRDTFFDTEDFALLSKNCFLKERFILDTEEEITWSYKSIQVHDVQLEITETKGLEDFIIQRFNLKRNIRSSYQKCFLHFFTRRLQIQLPNCDKAFMFVDSCQLESNDFYTVASYRYRPQDKEIASKFIEQFLLGFKLTPAKSKTLVGMYKKEQLRPFIDKLESQQLKDISFEITEDPAISDLMLMQVKDRQEDMEL